MNVNGSITNRRQAPSSSWPNLTLGIQSSPSQFKHGTSQGRKEQGDKGNKSGLDQTTEKRHESDSKKKLGISESSSNKACVREPSLVRVSGRNAATNSVHPLNEWIRWSSKPVFPCWLALGALSDSCPVLFISKQMEICKCYMGPQGSEIKWNNCWSNPIYCDRGNCFKLEGHSG